MRATVNRFPVHGDATRDPIARYCGHVTEKWETIMRTLLAILGIVVLVVVVLMALGFINIDQTRTAQLPSVHVSGGQAPKFQANVGSVDVGTKTETVKVPTVDVNKPGENQAAQ
jgi:hypothetical protein